MSTTEMQMIVASIFQNEISEFLNDILQPSKVLVSILSSNDGLAGINPQFLKKIIKGRSRCSQLF